MSRCVSRAWAVVWRVDSKARFASRATFLEGLESLEGDTGTLRGEEEQRVGVGGFEEEVPLLVRSDSPTSQSSESDQISKSSSLANPRFFGLAVSGSLRGEYWSFQVLITSEDQNASMLWRCGEVGMVAPRLEGERSWSLLGDLSLVGEAGGVVGGVV